MRRSLRNELVGEAVEAAVQPFQVALVEIAFPVTCHEPRAELESGRNVLHEGRVREELDKLAGAGVVHDAGRTVCCASELVRVESDDLLDDLGHAAEDTAAGGEGLQCGERHRLVLGGDYQAVAAGEHVANGAEGGLLEEDVGGADALGEGSNLLVGSPATYDETVGGEGCGKVEDLLGAFVRLKPAHEEDDRLVVLHVPEGALPLAAIAGCDSLQVDAVGDDGDGRAELLGECSGGVVGDRGEEVGSDVVCGDAGCGEVPAGM